MSNALVGCMSTIDMLPSFGASETPHSACQPQMLAVARIAGALVARPAFARIASAAPRLVAPLPQAAPSRAIALVARPRPALDSCLAVAPAPVATAETKRSIYQLPRRKRRTDIQKVAIRAKRRRLRANKPNAKPLKGGLRGTCQT